MSEGTAHRAISGTRAAHRYPLVLEMLADGRLHLSGLSLLAPHLTAENHEKLLEEAAGKTKASIREVLARWFPKPDVPDRVQPLSPKGEPSSLGLDGAPAGPRPRVEPLSEERFGVHFTGSARLREKLEHARNLMSHVSRKLEVVIERALDALIRELENKQWGKTDRPRRSRGTKDGSPSRKDKREVYERDDAQCAYVSEDGVRCTSKAFLQYDHTLPRALGGSGKADESRLLCQRAQLASRKTGFRPGARGTSDRLAPAKVTASRTGSRGAEAAKAPGRAPGPGLQEDREQAGRGQRGARRDHLVHGRAAPPCVRVARSRMISAPPSTPRSKSAPTNV
jgi:5-methylcytosine-specific restriction endonuclease McrA